MSLKARLTLLASCACILSGCALFDSDVMWHGGPYILLWIDTLDNTTLDYKLSDRTSIGRIDKTVYSVGWDGRYLVAKQHPSGDKSITNFYFIDSRIDSQSAEAAAVVNGPLTQAQFESKAKDLHLPAFSKTISALE